MLELIFLVKHFLVVIVLLVLTEIPFAFSEEIFEAILVVLLDVFYLGTLQFLFELLDLVSPEIFEQWQFALLFKFNHFLAEFSLPAVGLVFDLFDNLPFLETLLYLRARGSIFVFDDVEQLVQEHILLLAQTAGRVNALTN